MAEHKHHSRRTWIITGLIVAVIAGLTGTGIYLWIQSQQVYVDQASITAPEIALSPSQPGILQNVYVKEGDEVPANFTVAQVGNELIQTQVAGVIISVPNQIGSQVTAGSPVVTMIDPTQLRVVGQVQENEGLDRIKVGEPVTFTVDAYGGKTFSGVIDEVSPTSKQSQVVFNISNQREEQDFDVKARFDTTEYPQLKNGMSARMWIYTQ
ncbi:MAG: HlyD family efflux transporter periplasmic adaptor subunit [Candidatus Pacebacteria bacterium]|nr:HlyD family efflux transporter periplasmic adaptor subunit [Candidatus Paceibacterota bacterium]